MVVWRGNQSDDQAGRAPPVLYRSRLIKLLWEKLKAESESPKRHSGSTGKCWYCSLHYTLNRRSPLTRSDSTRAICAPSSIMPPLWYANPVALANYVDASVLSFQMSTYTASRTIYPLRSPVPGQVTAECCCLLHTRKCKVNCKLYSLFVCKRATCNFGLCTNIVVCNET